MICYNFIECVFENISLKVANNHKMFTNINLKVNNRFQNLLILWNIFYLYD